METQAPGQAGEEKSFAPPHGSQHLPHLRKGAHTSLPATQGPPGPVQTHTFQVQTVDTVPEVRELLGKQSGWWLRQEDTCRRQAGPP